MQPIAVCYGFPDSRTLILGPIIFKTYSVQGQDSLRLSVRFIIGRRGIYPICLEASKSFLQIRYSIFDKTCVVNLLQDPFGSFLDTVLVSVRFKREDYIRLYALL